MEAHLLIQPRQLSKSLLPINQRTPKRPLRRLSQQNLTLLLLPPCPWCCSSCAFGTSRGTSFGRRGGGEGCRTVNAGRVY